MVKKPLFQRVALTGGPGAGKSSLLDAIAERGIVTAGEVAREILQDDGGMALRRDDPLGFAQAMFEAQSRSWEQTSDEKPVVFDRGFADIVGFLRLEGIAVPERIDRAAREKRIDGPVFRAPAWRAIYHRDAERIQTWEEAVASDEAVCRAWQDYGYDLIDLPFKDIADRARFVLGRI